MKRISSHLACTRLSHVRLFRTAGPLLALIACAGLAAAPATAQSYTLTVLGTLGGSNSVGYGVNDAGQVAGWSQIAGNNATHAFLSAANGGALTDLGTLSGGDSFGFGVNNAGQVVGYSTIASSFVDYAFLYSGGMMTDLNTLIASSSGFTLEQATSISDTGFITGYGTDSSGQIHAFLLTPNFAPVPEASSIVSLGLLLTLGLGGAAVVRRKHKVA